MERISEDWLKNETAQRFLSAIEAAGYEGYFVGGCVRNALLGFHVYDLDISTNARPETVTKLAKSLGFKAIPTGIDHGTVTVVGDGEPLEVTTFRKDVMTDGRHAVVNFADNLEDDAARRDFRMNALYADARGKLYDPQGGLADIEARRIVFVGNAERRIREDYLRIVRLFRFAAQLGFGAEGIDSEAAKAAARLSFGLAAVSAERKTAEMLKLLSAPAPLSSLELMDDCGVLGSMLPGVSLALFRRYLAHEGQPDSVARLVALCFAQTVPNLRLSKADARFVRDVRTCVKQPIDGGEMGYRYGRRIAQTALKLRAALANRAPEKAELDAANAGDAAQFPITARDIPSLQGAELGQALKSLEAAWISSGFQAGKESLLAELSDKEG